MLSKEKMHKSAAVLAFLKSINFCMTESFFILIVFRRAFWKKSFKIVLSILYSVCFRIFKENKIVTSENFFLSEQIISENLSETLKKYFQTFSS